MSVTSTTRQAVGEAFARRDAAGRRLAEDAERIAQACRDMAARFHQGGKLIVFGNGGAGTDASHIAVEFMHPVIVGKRALPAMALGNDAATITGVGARDGFDEVFAHQIRHWADPADIALGISPDGRCANVLRGLETARELGLFTMALVGGDGGAVARSPAVHRALIARSGEPAVVKEIHVTTYHVLWELVHVFFAQTVPPRATRSEAAESATAPGRSPGHDRPGAPGAGGAADGASSRCAEDLGDVCLTCSDEALPARVIRLTGSGLAEVEAESGGGREQVSVALVDAGPGDTVLVHAKEAIAVITKRSGDGHG